MSLMRSSEPPRAARRARSLWAGQARCAPVFCGRGAPAACVSVLGSEPERESRLLWKEGKQARGKKGIQQYVR